MVSVTLLRVADPAIAAPVTLLRSPGRPSAGSAGSRFPLTHAAQLLDKSPTIQKRV
jgi:hypothetical protein